MELIQSQSLGLIANVLLDPTIPVPESSCEREDFSGTNDMCLLFSFLIVPVLALTIKDQGI